MSPEICIVTAIYKPNPEYLAEQIASFAQQSDQNFNVVFVIADGESADLVNASASAHNLQFRLITPPSRQDAVHAFGLGMEAALEDKNNALIALSDQDDIWHPERLAVGRQALAQSGADLVHSDARLVDASGKVIHKSMFKFEHRRKAPGLRGLLYRNTITGMTVMMRRELVEIALPLPAQSGVHFYHDLWLGLVASALKGVHLIDQPLVDYRQHGGNVVGAVTRAPNPLRSLRSRVPKLDKLWLRKLTASYALSRYLAQSLHGHIHAAIVTGKLAHGDATLSPLHPYMRSFGGVAPFLSDMLKLFFTGHLELAKIAMHSALVSTGRSAWITRHAFIEGRNVATFEFDQRLYTLSPGSQPNVPTPPQPEAPVNKSQNVSDIIDERKVPKWEPDFCADTPSLTIIVPTLNPSEVFAGIATAVDIGLSLAADGHHVRFIASDLPMASKEASMRFVLGRLPEDAAIDTKNRVSLHCSIQNKTIVAHKDDIFLATAWWSAHTINTLISQYGFTNERFFYLIQDFEPNFYPWGPEYADAWASYTFNFEPIFNTTLLREYFADQGFGFATPDTLAFRPSIDISHYSDTKRPAEKSKKRLALYGRPEVARNMFPTAVEALSNFVAKKNLGPDDIELISMGLQHAPVALPNGLEITSLGKLAWDDYPTYLLSVDIGLCLMYSPHPSHPPIEMAASGVRVVTNTFGPKDLGTLSPALLSAQPSAYAVETALEEAWDMAPVSQDARNIDLAPLGQTLTNTTQALSTKLNTLLKTES